jgi:trk system potassium uptake protein TrkH
MGILVFVIALMPKNTDRNIHILRAEMPGPTVDKIVPKSKDTAKILYLMYIGLTALLIILLAFGDMNLFESIVHAFGTAGTGGFAVKNAGLSVYSGYSQWVIAIFMLLFGVNFNLYFLLLLGKFKAFFKNTEFLTYLGIIVFSTIVICFNIYPLYNNLEVTIRTSLFQVSSLATTTGYSTADFTYWNSTSQVLLLFLMFVGGSAGSTAGGFKVSRIVLIFKRIKYELKKLIKPHSIDVMSMDGKKIEETTANSVMSYFGIYAVIFAITLFIISFDGFDFTTNFSATLACINNIGPGLSMVGPMSNFSCFSPLSKIVLTFAMLLGRLEIYPLLLAFTPTVWFKK